jgi:hypothetical protein
MKTALHPMNDTIIMAADYYKIAGGKFEIYPSGQTRLRARCTACLRALRMTDESRPVHEHSFAHMPDPSAYCPLKTGADNRYVDLTAIPKDVVRGKQLRVQFFKQWDRHFAAISRHVFAFDINDFINRINLADSSKLWDCSQLNEWEIPYVFMVWRAFEPITNQKTKQVLRQEWLRFYYDAQVRTLADIWVKLEQPLFIVKASYKPLQSNKKPTADDINQTVRFEVNPHILDWVTPKPNSYQVKTMHRTFRFELGDEPTNPQQVSH